MSKLLNKTAEGLQPGGRRLRPITEETEIRDRMEAVHDPASMGCATVTRAGQAAPKPFSAQTGSDVIARPAESWRLQDCRKIRLSRESQKSFLAKEYNTDLQAAVEAYRTLRTRLLSRQAKDGLRSLAVSGTAPGEGKTLTALNLALCYSHLPDRTILLVDGDLRTKGLSHMLGLQQLAGLGDILESGRPYQSAVLRTDLANLCVLPAGTSSMPSAELLSLEGWKEFVAWGSSTFEMMLVDSPPILDLADTELILSTCDGMLLVTRAGATKRQTFVRVLDQVDGKKLVGIVFNGYNDPNATRYYQYRYNGAKSNPSARER